MQILTWSAKRRLIIFLGVAAVVFFVIYFIFSSVVPEATCSDRRQNQGEEGVDCGGPCTPCVVSPKEVVALWTRLFPTGEKSASGGKLYEAAALVENPNISYGLPLFKYTFRLYDSNNILVGVKEGQTFLNPADKFVIFVSDIDAGAREPVRAFVEIENLSDWVYAEHEKTPIVISQKSFTNKPFPVLQTSLHNESLFPVKNIEASAVLFDQEGNAIGVSSTKINVIAAENDQSAVFSWPEPFVVEPVSNRVYTRTDFTESLY